MQDDKASLDTVVKRQLSLRSRLILRRVRKYFLTGILVTAPIAITLYLAYIFLVFMDSQVGKILPGDTMETGHSPFPGLGLIITLIFFIVVGWLASNVIGQLCVDCSEYVMTRMPIIRTLYNSIKQVIETLMGSQAKAFREVVLIEYPRKGSWTLGFVTGKPEGEIQDNVQSDELVNVFVPTAPSPVNGFLLFIPRSEIIPLKMTVEEGIKMVVSVGIIAPVEKPPEKQKAA